MSNRTEADVSAQAELRASHLAQIEVLTKPGLTEPERIKRFFEAAGYDDEFNQKTSVGLLEFGYSAAHAVWIWGHIERSLFANLPGCSCPVLEGLQGFPSCIEGNWRPTVTDLEAFSRIQIEQRFPSR